MWPREASTRFIPPPIRSPSDWIRRPERSATSPSRMRSGRRHALRMPRGKPKSPGTSNHGGFGETIRPSKNFRRYWTVELREPPPRGRKTHRFRHLSRRIYQFPLYRTWRSPANRSYWLTYTWVLSHQLAWSGSYCEWYHPQPTSHLLDAPSLLNTYLVCCHNHMSLHK